jgi:hypothetical protein
MRSHWFRPTWVVLVLLTSCIGQEKAIDPKWAASSIGTVLNEARASGSLAYWGWCDYKGGSSDFPALRAPDNRTNSPLQTLREMFIDDKEMRIVKESSGLIRMFETDVPHDLLDVKVRHISFKAMNSPIKALWVILRAPEVEAFMRAKNVGPPLPDSFFFSILSGAESPIISGDLDNVTVSQALDYVLQTYPGFWTYENCQTGNGGRAVFFDFFPRAQPGMSKLR